MRIFHLRNIYIYIQLSSEFIKTRARSFFLLFFIFVQLHWISTMNFFSFFHFHPLSRSSSLPSLCVSKVKDEFDFELRLRKMHFQFYPHTPALCSRWVFSQRIYRLQQNVEDRNCILYCFLCCTIFPVLCWRYWFEALLKTSQLLTFNSRKMKYIFHLTVFPFARTLQINICLGKVL